MYSFGDICHFPFGKHIRMPVQFTYADVKYGRCENFEYVMSIHLTLSTIPSPTVRGEEKISIFPSFDIIVNDKLLKR